MSKEEIMSLKNMMWNLEKRIHQVLNALYVFEENQISALENKLDFHKNVKTKI